MCLLKAGTRSIILHYLDVRDLGNASSVHLHFIPDFNPNDVDIPLLYSDLL